MDYRKKLMIAPGERIKLEAIDPGYHGKHEHGEAAAAEIQAALDAMRQLQFRLYAERRHGLLIVLQGIDAAGKDGVCRHVIAGMNPQGCAVRGFKQPTAEELDHDFLWRIHPHVPGPGQVAVFNRSHYEDVLVTRVHKLVPKKQWSLRYDRINEFERLLTDAGTTIIKLFLYISKDEQLGRFKARLEDPERQWKISNSDYAERAYWDDYIQAYQDMMERCSTEHAPWYAIPSNHKWFRNLAVSRIIVATMQDMDMKMPEPTVDLDRIRTAYHAAAEAAGDLPKSE